MNPLVKESLIHTKFNELLSSVKNNEKNLSITGVTDSAKAHLLYSLYNYSGKIPVIVCANNAVAQKLIQDLKYYAETEIVFLPGREITYYTYEVKSREKTNARLYAINKLVNNEECIIVTTVDAISQRMLNREVYKGVNISLKVGDEIDINNLVSSLMYLGYIREETVDCRGKFSIRGGIIDIFPIEESSPFRIELFGSEIDSIRKFNVDTQRSMETMDGFNISFSNEFIFSSEKKNEVIAKLRVLEEEEKDASLQQKISTDISYIEEGEIDRVIDRYFDLFEPSVYTLLDYIDDSCFLCFDEITKCIARFSGIKEENDETQKILIEKKEIYPKYTNRPLTFEEIEVKFKYLCTVYLERINQSRVLHAKRKEYSFSCREVNFFRGSMDIFIKEMEKLKKEEYKVVLVFSTLAKVENIKRMLEDSSISCKYIESINMLDTIPTGIIITQGFISAGFVYDELKLAVYTEQVSGIRQKKSTSKEFLGNVLNSYEELKPGDYIVHVNHGIGQYLGIEQVDVGGIVKDYMKLLYKDNGTLYIPVTSLDSIKKYVCEDGFVPKLNKLGGSEWEKTKNKVSSHVKNIAKDLVSLYAKRTTSKGHAFSKDTPWQIDFENDFPYEPTEDQLRCIKEIKEDMEAEKPMDRLLCGDVGYGKTEVAIRAAFKAIMDGKQVAYLVPTTVLSMQQYNVFKERMQDYGISVEMLSRFKSPKEQEKVIADLKSGKVDLVVGTHRLLSKDVKFKDLGLLIIDEEHRFGVEHKEVIKKYRNNIDVLSMTATPIPRTLHMSMIGIRDISIILEPPLERLPVHTYVLEYTPSIISEGIEKELARNGQVFYLSNKVENIESIVAKVQTLAPSARIDFAHGKMSTTQIEDVMYRFVKHETDILVCTTILESGIDIPNANTIIVENADKLGLAQLYQIRGRVGRSSRLAYAYITYNKSGILSDEASKRLKAIKDFTEFGSGFKIALRDLEIRGAGNLLGSEQSGHMLSVGYDMYSELLRKAVEQEKNNISDESPIDITKEDVKISLDVSANIPDDYIKNTVIKIEMYQKLSSCEKEDEIQDVIDEFIDRFGDMPQDTLNLIHIIRIRNTCRKIGITEIGVQGEFLFFVSKYVTNKIKYRLTNNIKHDILSYVDTVLDNMKDVQIT